MASVKINLAPVKAVLSEYDIPRSELNAYSKVVRTTILAEVAKNLVKEANANLNTSKAIYISSIRLRKNELYLQGQLANEIESGGGVYDMKVNFMNSAKVVRTKKGGWYLTIPFRIGTPNSTGSESSAIMSWDIYRAIRSGRKPDLTNYPPNSRPEVTNSKGKVFSEYQHISSIFEGINKTYNPVTGKNTYNTFRRVSNNSDPNSWINRGIQARNLMDKAWERTDVNKIIDDSLDILFGND